MNKSWKWNWAPVALVAIITLSLALAGNVLAGKGGKGNGGGGSEEPTPEGTIYYSQGRVLATDAAGADPLSVLPAGFTGAPSNRLYGDGYRWWLTIEEVEGSTRTYPGTNAPHRELYVFRASADGETVDMFRLTNLIDANVNGIGPLSGAVWSKGTDAFVSFVGYDFDLGDYFIFRIPFGIGADGEPLVDEMNLEHAVNVPSHVLPYDWSPTGGEVVYEYTGGIWVQSVGAETEPTLMSPGREPQWSPDGNWIALTDNSAAYGRLKVIDAETGDVTTSLETEFQWYNDISWSPDSTAIAFTLQRLKGRLNAEEYYYDAAWMPAAGGTIVNLTSDRKDAAAFTIGWLDSVFAPQ